jgi:hypothetical protein
MCGDSVLRQLVIAKVPRGMGMGGWEAEGRGGGEVSCFMNSTFWNPPLNSFFFFEKKSCNIKWLKSIKCRFLELV